MSKSLYVGNLPYSVTEAQLRELFSQAGEVTRVTIMLDRETGQARGFGFVEMQTDEQGREAMRRFHNYTLGSRRLLVDVARPRGERADRGDDQESSNPGFKRNQF